MSQAQFPNNIEADIPESHIIIETFDAYKIDCSGKIQMPANTIPEGNSQEATGPVSSNPQVQTIIKTAMRNSRDMEKWILDTILQETNTIQINYPDEIGSSEKEAESLLKKFVLNIEGLLQIASPTDARDTIFPETFIKAIIEKIKVKHSILTFPDEISNALDSEKMANVEVVIHPNGKEESYIRMRTTDDGNFVLCAQNQQTDGGITRYLYELTDTFFWTETVFSGINIVDGANTHPQRIERRNKKGSNQKIIITEGIDDARYHC